MKSFNGLMDRMLDLNEIKLAILEAAEGKMDRPSVRRRVENLDESAQQIYWIIQNGWKPHQHRRGRIFEGGHKKPRDNIQKPAWWPEQVIHHLVVRQLKPILVPRMHRYVCGTIGKIDVATYWQRKKGKRPCGRGALFACRTIRRWRNSYKGRKFYVLETDIHHFYDTISIDILMAILERRIRDREFLELCREILVSAGPGIPKGFYTSPWFAQAYLEDFDNFILQKLKPDHYLRYMDNIYLFSKNKRKLRRMRDAMQGYLQTYLGLSLKDTTQVFRFEYADGKGRPIQCLGFIIHRNRVTLRKNILKRIRAKAWRMHRKRRCTVRDAQAMLSYKGWLKHTDTYTYFQKYIQPVTNLRYCRRRVSMQAKREAQQRVLENCS